MNKLEANEVANKASLSQEFYIWRLAERAYTYSLLSGRPPLKFIWSEDQAFEEFDIGSCTWSRVSERNLERVA